MTIIYKYLMAALIGYIFGSSNMAYYISKAKNINFKQNGSKNLGASNATYLLGKKAGIITLIHDILKVVLASYITSLLFIDVQNIAIFTAAFAILGHIFPFYLKFDGGKGFASYLGAVLIINWKLFIPLIILIIILAFITNYIVSGTFFTAISTPIYIYFTLNLYLALLFTIVSLIIFIKHKENIIRIKNNQEFKVRSIIFKK